MTAPKSPSPWHTLAQTELKGQPAESLTRPTLEGIDQQALYTPDDVAETAATTTAAQLPGFAPFTRGIRATMYAGKPWTIRQYAGFSTAEESNAFYKQALASGQTGLSVAFDLPTHRGYDSDHERAQKDVGKAGVAIDSVDDMKRLFADIDLGAVSVSMTMNGAVLPIMAAYIVAAEEQGCPQTHLTGTLQNDILKEFLVRNTYIYPPQASLRITGDIIAYTAQQMPRFNPISISGYHMQEAGAHAADELAFTLADGLAYVEVAKQRGLDVDAFAPRLSFFFGIGMNFFMEIAKLRAARTLWAELMQQRHAPKNPQSLMLRTHCQTSGVSLTEQDPLNNIVRTTIEAMAAVLGGTQSLHTNAYDEALALPSEQAARIARNTQLILAEEAGFTQPVDPLGGSYYIENLTAQLIDKARATIAEIDKLGGMAQALDSGFVQSRIETTALMRQARVDSGQQVIVGVNKYTAPTGQAKEPHSLREIDNAQVLTAQLAGLKQLRATRDNNAVEKALAELEAAAQDTQANLLAATIPAMRARATVGEVSAVLERVFTRHRAMLKSLRGVYAAQRQHDPALAEVQQAVAQAGHPKLMVLKLGQDGHDRGAKVVAGAFADLGFEVISGPLFDSPSEGATRAVESGVQIVGISSLAGAHKALIAEFMHHLRAAPQGREMIVVVGGVIPPQDYEALFELGVAAIYGPGTEMLSAARELLALLQRRNEPPRSHQ